MATIGTANSDNMRNTPRRSYVAGIPFNNNFFTYSASSGGSLTVVTTNAALTPAGRTLRENGRKLYPGVNPGVTKYMVGVYDDQSLLSGFIYPNAPVWSILSNDKPNFLPNDTDPVTGLAEYGQPVYTNGNVTSGGNYVTANVAGTFVSTGVAIATGAGAYAQATGVFTFTVSNTGLAVGQTVAILGTAASGSTPTSLYNVSGVIATLISTTGFTINGTIGLNGGSNGSAIDTAGALYVLASTGSSVAVIQNASYATATGLYTYTAPNTFAPGQTVAVSGVVNSTSTPTTAANFYNITGVVTSSSTNTFTLIGASGLVAPASFTVGSGTASLVVESVNAGNSISATITNATYSTPTFTYTAANSFTPGQNVTISNVASTVNVGGFNISGVVATASATGFTVVGAAGLTVPTYTSGGVAVVNQKSLQITSRNITINGGFVQRVITSAAAIGTSGFTSIALDLAVGNVFYFSTTLATGNVTFTLLNSVAGSTFYIVMVGTGSLTVTIGNSSQAIAVNGATVATPPVVTPVATVRTIYTCIVLA